MAAAGVLWRDVNPDRVADAARYRSRRFNVESIDLSSREMS
jgi:hypothetical protein